MPIEPTVQVEAEGAFEVVHATLSERALAKAFSLPKLSNVKPDALSIAMPHRVEFANLDDIRRETIPRKKADLWRFLVLKERTSSADGGEAAGSTGFEAIAAATAVRKGERFVFGGLDEGPFVKGTEATIRGAEALEEVREGRFEAVLLVVPALYVVALWLQALSSQAANDRSSEADLVIPLPPPSNPALDPGTPLTPASFLKALHVAR